jgi:hypothetical protein
LLINYIFALVGLVTNQFAANLQFLGQSSSNGWERNINTDDLLNSSIVGFVTNNFNVAVKSVKSPVLAKKVKSASIKSARQLC